MSFHQPRSRLALWGAAGVLGAGVIGGTVISQVSAASAASGTTTTTTASPPARPHGPGPGGFGGPMGGLGRPLYGQTTVLTPGGKTEVVDTQNGTVVSASSTSVTVQSAGTGNKEISYTLTSSTKVIKNGASGSASSLSKGDHVHVVAIAQSSGNASAVAIMDGRPPRPPRPAGGPHGTPPAPPTAPSTSSSASS